MSNRGSIIGIAAALNNNSSGIITIYRGQITISSAIDAKHNVINNNTF
jgi:hypothetical protein